MKIDYPKDKKRFISIVLLWFSVLLGVLILVKTAGFFVASASAKSAVEKAVTQNNSDANNMEKYFAKSKAIADELKKKNLFIPPQKKQHPVNQVLGILGSEALINGKWYKTGDKIADAIILTIKPTHVRIEWDGREKVFSPMQAGISSGPGGPGRGRPGRTATREDGGRRERAEMVVIRPRGSGREGRRRFGLSSEDRARMRERWENASPEERERMRAEMRERSGGRRGRGGY